MNPFFSIITASYNSEKTIRKTIESILSQSHQEFEYIIIDGLSTDRTLSIVDEYSCDKITLISEKDDGIYDAWNKGLKISKGEWIMFIGSDDSLKEDALKNYFEFAQNHSYEYISSVVELVNADYHVLRKIGKPWNWKYFKKYMCVAHVGSIHHRSLFKKYGFFNVTYKITGDYEFLLRAKAALNAGFLSEITAQMQIGGVSLNSKVFCETFRSKIETANRNYILSKVEMYKAIIVFYLRKALNKQ